MSNIFLFLNGPAGSGKDTLASHLVEKHGFTRFAFADSVREVALTLNPYVPTNDKGNVIYVRLKELVDAYGWEDAKRNVSEVRRLLQVIGTEVGRDILPKRKRGGETVWFTLMCQKIDKYAKNFTEYDPAQGKYARVVITDCRFTDELNLCARLNTSLVVGLVRVEREGLPKMDHVSESFDITSEDTKQWLFEEGYFNPGTQLNINFFKVENKGSVEELKEKGDDLISILDREGVKIL